MANDHPAPDLTLIDNNVLANLRAAALRQTSLQYTAVKSDVLVTMIDHIRICEKRLHELEEQVECKEQTIEFYRKEACANPGRH